jgi:hypothetical protein
MEGTPGSGKAKRFEPGVLRARTDTARAPPLRSADSRSVVPRSRILLPASLSDGVDDAFVAPRNGGCYVVFGRQSFGPRCLSATLCVDLSAALATSCTDVGGTFSGINTDCATTVCPGCPGDLDHDGDTDVFDFGLFAPGFGCGTGRDVA